MAQEVAVVRASLSAVAAGTTDFTLADFGTPTAAIIISGNANTTNNPQDNAGMSIGFWDGTNQRCMSTYDLHNVATTDTRRRSQVDRGAVVGQDPPSEYTVSAVTDGIRLTMDVDNTGVQRFCTVLLLKGVSAKAGTFQPNATQNATAESASLGFSLETGGLIFFLCIGANAETADTTGSILTFGFAHNDTVDVHRMVGHSSVDAVAAAVMTQQYLETRCCGQVFNGALTWAGEVTTFGPDTFTMTTRDGASGSDFVYFLALGGADLKVDVGGISTPTSTGTEDTSTVLDPDAVVIMLGTAKGTVLETDADANGIMVGIGDDAGEFSHNIFSEDAASTTNTGSVVKAAQIIDLDSSAAGSRTDVIDATIALGSAKFTLDYSRVDGSARKGWFVSFGSAAAGGNIDGTTPATSSLFGTLAALGTLVGSMAAVVTIAATLSAKGDLAGTVAGLSTWTATVFGRLLAEGTISATSTFAATLRAKGDLVGTLNPVSTFSATLDPLPGPIDGTLVASSVWTATLEALGTLNGTLTARSSWLGSMVLESFERRPYYQQRIDPSRWR